MSHTLFETEVGIVLVFDFLLDGSVPDLTGATLNLHVVDNPNSPFALINDLVKGRATYAVQAGDFPAGTYTAFIKYELGPVKLTSIPFKIRSLPDPTTPVDLAND